jgi:hypothetical protein
MRVLASLLSLCLSVILAAQESPGNAPAKPAIVLEDSPQTAKEATERLAAKRKVIDTRMAELEKIHADEIAKIEAQAIADLKQIAKSAVAGGDIVTATAAWTEVIKIDPADKDAIAFFKTINRMDLVKETALKPSRNQRSGQIKTVGTYEFLDSYKRPIDTFQCLSDGNVRGAVKYPDAKWVMLNESTVIFGYTSDGGWIAMKEESPGFFAGKSPDTGSPRYLRRK